MDSCLELLRKKYELIVCGSNQIWNPNITGGFQDYYFGVNRGYTGVLKAPVWCFGVLPQISVFFIESPKLCGKI